MKRAAWGSLRSRVRQGLAAPGAAAWSRLPFGLRRWILHRSNDRFLLGVLGLVLDPEDRVLLLEHRFRVPFRWGLPGGFVHHGEGLQAALRRELREEIGMELDLDPVPFHVGLSVSGRNLSTVFVARPAGPVAPLRVSDGLEITGGGFFGPGELPAGLYPKDEALILDLWRKVGRA